MAKPSFYFTAFWVRTAVGCCNSVVFFFPFPSSQENELEKTVYNLDENHLLYSQYKSGIVSSLKIGTVL